MIAGELDLSVGALFTFGPYMMVLAWIHGVPEAIAVLCALATAVVVGLVNGFITLKFNIPSFITTLGTLFIIRSGSRVITGMKPLPFRADETFFTLLASKIFGVIPAQFLWFLGFAVIAYLILNRHRIGNRFFAVGGNPEAARAVGINVFQPIASMHASSYSPYTPASSKRRWSSATNSRRAERVGGAGPAVRTVDPHRRPRSRDVAATRHRRGDGRVRSRGARRALWVAPRHRRGRAQDGVGKVRATLSRLGGQLVALHLMESPKLDGFVTRYEGTQNPDVGRIGWSDGTVWLDAGKTNAREKYRASEPGTNGFTGVPEAVWDFHIGGYQVCHKWLKDRKRRTLSEDDVCHYQKIVVALNETIRLMREIDEVIDQHGGWPDAFQVEAEESERE